MRVMKRGRVGALALALALLVGTGGAAQAALGLKSERGWGYSQDHNGRKQVKACDTKGDGHPVYAQFKRTGSGTTYYVEDNDGANNGCVSSGSSSNLIYQHRVGLEIAVLPDSYGPWVYPS